jgi:hypothetical protein
MALQSTYIGIVPRTINNDSTDLALGVRVTLASTGLAALSLISVRGDFTTLQTIPASKPGEAASMQSAGRVPALASEAVSAGDPAYSAASGQYSKTSASAVLVGKWYTTTASGAIGEVELGNPA